MKRFLPLVLLLGGCGTHFASFGDSNRQRDLSFDEMRVELGDLRHTIQAQKTDLALLQERLQEQEVLLEQTGRHKISTESLSARLASLERQHERVLQDMALLKQFYERSDVQGRISSLQVQIDQCISKLNDFQQLKSTLTQVSRAIGDKLSSTQYRVKPGDTLDKIAKQQHVSIADIKRLNSLHSDKIFVGQELLLEQP